MRLNQWHDVPDPTWERTPDGTHNGEYPGDIPAYLSVSRYGVKRWRWGVLSKTGVSPKAPLGGFAPTWHQARKAAHRAYIEYLNTPIAPGERITRTKYRLTELSDLKVGDVIVEPLRYRNPSDPPGTTRDVEPRVVGRFETVRAIGPDGVDCDGSMYGRLCPPVYVLIRPCPDDGRCHHDCAPNECWRVATCGPLSAAHFPNDEWPATIVKLYTPKEPS